jgi:hypothetical protein
MEYVKRLSKKEAAESVGRKGNPGRDQTVLQSVKRTLVLWRRSVQQFPQSPGMIGK